MIIRFFHRRRKRIVLEIHVCEFVVDIIALECKLNLEQGAYDPTTKPSLYYGSTYVYLGIKSALASMTYRNSVTFLKLRKLK